ncbi:acyltransferase [Pseudomonas frederiksbergensis]|uniref:acyltransferase n=1 Tax=Pseudomonas frederiksbergensis TaxID=104087 RepID=UPI00160EE9C7|nr:acyltransferase [Pseudomonas frederiksbergensis]
MACIYENFTIPFPSKSRVSDRAHALLKIKTYIDVGDGTRFDGFPKITFTKISKPDALQKSHLILEEFNDCISIGSNCYIDSTDISAFHSSKSKLTCAKLLHNPPGKIRIGDNVSIFCTAIISYGLVTIGDNSVISAMCTIMDSNGHPTFGRTYLDEAERINFSSVTIGKNVWIGINCTVLPGVHIGDNCVIGANAVIRSNIPENCIAAGNPAKVLKKLPLMINPNTTEND